MPTPNKIFSMDDVREIRRVIGAKENTIAELARGHLVSQSTIRRIVLGQTYREDNQHSYIKGIGYKFLG